MLRRPPRFTRTYPPFPYTTLVRSLDAAHLSQCEGQLILARVRGELAKNLAGGDDPRCDRRHDAQDVGPVALDERFIDLTSDQRSHIGRRRVGREGIESFLREIA